MASHPSRLKILFVLENYYPKIGGVETLFKGLTDQLSAEGHDCIVITSWPGGDVPRREVVGRTTVIRIAVLSRYLFTLLALIPILRQVKRCDLVHTTSYNAALPAFLATRFVRKKILITFHEVWGRLWFQLPMIGTISKRGHYLFEQLLVRLPFDRFVAASEATATRLVEEGVSPDRVSVIYPGVDYALFEKPASPDRNVSPYFTYTYFGRLGISKGLDLLLEAARTLKHRLPDSRLQLILPLKPKQFYKWVRRYITRHDLDDYIIVRHHLPFDQLKETVRQSDCVVIPSHSEGFCYVAAESIALGTPLVSSQRAALREVVGGRFVPISPLSADGIVDAILEAHAGNWHERPVRRFHLRDTIARYVSEYASFVAGA